MAVLQNATTADSSLVWHRGNYPGNTFFWSASGSYTANTWTTITNWNDLGLDGFVYITGFADTNGAGGAAWSSQYTCPGIFPVTQVYSNSSHVTNFGSAVYAGHAPNGEGWSFRLVHQSQSSPTNGRVLFQALSTRNVSALDGTSRRNFNIRIRTLKIGF